MKVYEIDYWKLDDWGADWDTRFVTMDEIIELAEEWETTVDELMEQVTEMDETEALALRICDALECMDEDKIAEVYMSVHDEDEIVKFYKHIDLDEDMMVKTYWDDPEIIERFDRHDLDCIGLVYRWEHAGETLYIPEGRLINGGEEDSIILWTLAQEIAELNRGCSYDCDVEDLL